MISVNDKQARTSKQSLFSQVLLSLLIFGLAFGLVVWRNDQAPDLLTDEILYSRLGMRVLNEGAVVWDHGTMSVIHPPYYYLLNSVFLGITGTPGAELLAPGNIFEFVYHDRILNALLAGISAVIIFGIGLRLRGLWLGLLLTLLFVFDPFGIRINRRAMLETLAGLLSLIGLLIFITGSKKIRKLGYGILAGIFFGAGILTKELAFILPLAVLIYGLWEVLQKDQDWRYPIITAGISLTSYLVFPIWILYTGNWTRFINVKTLALERLVGLVHTSGWNRPGVSFLDFLLNRLLDYGSSYLILLLGGIATLVILIRHRNEPMGRLLGTWGVLIYPLYGFITLFGSGNDQFFYFLLLPSIILLGYAVIEKDDRGMNRLVTRSWNLMRSQPRALFRMRDRNSGILIGFIILILVVIIPFNIFSWISNYGVGLDTGYLQLSNYIQSNIPAGTPINASGDSLKYMYFLPNHPIAEAESQQDALNLGVKYFVIVPKDIQSKFGKVSEEFASWIISNGQLIFSTSGDTYGDIFMYIVPHIGEPLGEPLDGSGDPRYERTFGQATTGFVGSLLVLMGILYLLYVWMLIALARRHLVADISTGGFDLNNTIGREDDIHDSS
jgi:4-amino-4-deoxy-L-arabinose transferase-like glycosyltransferase